MRLDGVPLEGDADTLAEAERLFLDAVSDEPESSWLEDEEPEAALTAVRGGAE